MTTLLLGFVLPAFVLIGVVLLAFVLIAFVLLALVFDPDLDFYLTSKGEENSFFI